MVYWIDFVRSPIGFYGKDIAIDLISALVLIILGFFAFKLYKLDKENKRHFLLTGAFLILGGSFIVKSLTNILSHHPIGISKYLTGLLIPNIIPEYAMLPAIGFLSYAILTIFGFYFLYAVTSKHTLISTDYLIIAYFIVIAMYFARFNYYLLYLSSLIFLVAITRRYFISYRETKYKNKLNLAISFLIISLTQLLFIFSAACQTLYMIAEIIQLIGYLFLLYTFIMVLRNAKKKK